jgi:hypothetical protein
MIPAIRYSLATGARVSIRLLDLSGRVAQTLSDAVRQPGRDSVPSVPEGLARGVYLLKMRADEYQANRKLILQ